MKKTMTMSGSMEADGKMIPSMKYMPSKMKLQPKKASAKMSPAKIAARKRKMISNVATKVYGGRPNY